MEGKGIFAASAEAEEANEKLQMLENLTPEEVLRYKCFTTSRIPTQFIEAVCFNQDTARATAALLTSRIHAVSR